MISLSMFAGLGAEAAPSATPSMVPTPVVQKLTTKVLSRWDVLVVGIITGFGLAAGSLVFNKISKRLRWQ